MVEVFFDGKCGLCSKEIRYYQRIAPANRFIWQDIAHDPQPLAKLGLSQAEALKYLHVRDKTGQLYIGLDAFIVIWLNLPKGWRYLAFISRLPILHFLGSFLYRRFAAYRFARLSHCQLAEAQPR